MCLRFYNVNKLVYGLKLVGLKLVIVVVEHSKLLQQERYVWLYGPIRYYTNYEQTGKGDKFSLCELFAEAI